MKKIVCILAMLAAMMSFSLIVHADGYCPENDDYTHHYDASASMACEHPHAGYLDCLCGSRYRLNKIYKYDCEKCREELCNKGYHYYLNELQYENENGVIYLLGTCMCGEQICLDVYVDGISQLEPRDKLFYCDGKLIVDPLYSHVELVNSNEIQAFYDTDCEGQCGACSYMSEYIENIYELSIWDYEQEVEEYYEGYVTRRQDEGTRHEDEDYNDNTQEDYEELYDWLADVKNLFE